MTAKSRPMMSLIARVPSNVSSSTSVCPEKKSYGSQSPWSAKAEKDDRTGQPVSARERLHTQHATQSGMITKLGLLKSGKLNNRWMMRTEQPVVTSWGKTHESQSSFFHEKTQHDGTGQPVVIPQRERRPQQFIIGNDETESELSMGIQIILKQGE